MASSPLVPGSAKQLRIKKRMINIVNPAGKSYPISCLRRTLWIEADGAIDPDSFSTDQFPMDDDSAMGQRRERETTPLQDVSSHTPMTGTPSGSEVAKRGILRPTGTPGSGNGGQSPQKSRSEKVWLVSRGS